MKTIYNKTIKDVHTDAMIRMLIDENIATMDNVVTKLHFNTRLPYNAFDTMRYLCVVMLKYKIREVARMYGTPFLETRKTVFALEARLRTDKKFVAYLHKIYKTYNARVATLIEA